MLNLLCNAVETNIRLGTNFFCGYGHLENKSGKPAHQIRRSKREQENKKRAGYRFPKLSGSRIYAMPANSGIDMTTRPSIFVDGENWAYCVNDRDKEQKWEHRGTTSSTKS